MAPTRSAALTADPWPDPVRPPLPPGTVFYVNTLAGSGRAAGVWHRLVAAHPELAAAPRVEEIDPATAARRLDELLVAGAHRVIAVGGDGTLHWVVQRLLAVPKDRRPAVGIVPAGTGSDFARHLKLPRRPELALTRALTAVPRPVDVIAAEPLQVDGSLPGDGAVPGAKRRFIFNVASLGLSGIVAERVNAMGDRGALPFIRGTVEGILRYRPCHCRVMVDGEPWYEGGLFLLALANAPYFGKAMKIAPGASIDDGLMNVVLVKPLSRPESLLRLPQIFFGTHVRSRKVLQIHAREVVVHPLDTMPPLELDGELWEPPPLRFSVEPGALAFSA